LGEVGLTKRVEIGDIIVAYVKLVELRLSYLRKGALRCTIASMLVIKLAPKLMCLRLTNSM
jgi:hypothetical protein